MFSIYKSIIGCLEAHGKSIEDIEWIGSDSFTIPIENFCKLSKSIPERNRDDDVPYDLLLVGKDFWIERFSDDCGHGSWEFKRFPEKPSLEYPIKALNCSQFSPEEFEQLNELLVQRYQKTHAEKDYPYYSGFRLQMMLYKK